MSLHNKRNTRVRKVSPFLDQELQTRDSGNRKCCMGGSRNFEGGHKPKIQPRINVEGEGGHKSKQI